MNTLDIERKPIDVDVPGFGVVRLTGEKADVYEAFVVCLRRQPDATFSEMLEVLSAQFGRQLQVNVYSGRPSELVKLNVLEKCSERREDAAVRRKRASGHVARDVTAWRHPSGQARLCA